VHARNAHFSAAEVEADVDAAIREIRQGQNWSQLITLILTVFLDSNILISAFLTPKGVSSEVYRQVTSHSLFVSPFILSGVLDTLHAPRLRKKYDYSDDEIERYIQELISASDIVEPISIG
jgi:predicted nucleic acid-binding protein